MRKGYKPLNIPPYPPVINFFQQHCTSYNSPIIPSTGNQVLKFLNLLGTFSFKPPTPGNLISVLRWCLDIGLLSTVTHSTEELLPPQSVQSDLRLLWAEGLP